MNVIDAIKKFLQFIKILIPEKTSVSPVAIPTPIPPKIEIPKNELYDVAAEWLGKRITLDPSVPPEVSCAEAISFLLHACGVDIPPRGIAGTYTLAQFLRNNKRIEQISEPELGAILLYATGTSKFPSTPIEKGHVFVIGHFHLLSNNSRTSLFDDFYTLETARKRWEIEGGYKPNYFRLLPVDNF